MDENLKHTVINHLTKSVDNIDNFRELLLNYTTHFFRVHIKQYSHFQRVTTKQEQTHFLSSYQALLTLLGSYSKTILQTFPDIKQY